MNRRQKKKQYKKMHGHNPVKRPDGRYILNLQAEKEERTMRNKEVQKMWQVW